MKDVASLTMVHIRIIHLKSMVRKSLSAMPCRVKPYVPALPVKSKLEEADSLELLSEASEIRVKPVCPHFGVCGGCNMQHIHPDAQIELKQNVLKSHLQHFAGIQPVEWLPPLRSQREDYRRKARIGVRYLPQKKSWWLVFVKTSPIS